MRPAGRDGAQAYNGVAGLANCEATGSAVAAGDAVVLTLAIIIGSLDCQRLQIAGQESGAKGKELVWYAQLGANKKTAGLLHIG